MIDFNFHVQNINREMSGHCFHIFPINIDRKERTKPLLNSLFYQYVLYTIYIFT